ncbi:MAG: 3-hydroxyisobutyrate dehydrogenase [Atopobiaceae bacterium]|nr:3-hydroxyisobutyrate dehydrogenase [Atopobiaceae bacterium]
MDKELFDFVAERVDILKVSNASLQETKDRATAWKKAVSADSSDEVFETETNALLDYLMTRLVTIDQAIAFAEGPAKDMFGAEAAANMLAEQKERKENGEKYCNCENHTASTQLLAKFGRIEL